jgi:hypothetical protein
MQQTYYKQKQQMQTVSMWRENRKVKFTLEQAMKTPSESSNLALHFHYVGVGG